MGRWSPEDDTESNNCKRIYKYFVNHKSTLSVRGPFNTEYNQRFISPKRFEGKFKTMVILTPKLFRIYAKKAFGKKYSKYKHGETVANFHKYIANKRTMILPTKYQTKAIKQHWKNNTESLNKPKQYYVFDLDDNIHSKKYYG